MKIVKALIVFIILGIGIIVAYGFSGLYDVAVGSGHNALTGWYLHLVRERSIEARAADLTVPADLASTERVQAGAGHYKEMCAGCHGRPGKEPADVFEPRPPALYRHAEPPAEAFWIIKHGIKMSAMPSHLDHSDEDIWNIVAFLQQLPELSADDYAAITVNATHSHADDQAHEDDASQQEPAAPESAEHHHDAPMTPTATVVAFQHALQEGNSNAALALLHDEATILEAGHLETKQAYAAGHLAHDIEFLAQVQSKVLSREETVGEGQAVVMSRVQMTGSVGDKPVDITVSETTVLLQTDAGWRIAQLNWM